MRVPRTLHTAMFVVLPLVAASCMGGFPTEIPPTPGATHANYVVAGVGRSNSTQATSTSRTSIR